MTIGESDRSKTMSKLTRGFSVAVIAGAIVALLVDSPVVVRAFGPLDDPAQTTAPAPSRGEPPIGNGPVAAPMYTATLDASFDNKDLGRIGKKNSGSSGTSCSFSAGRSRRRLP